MPFPSAPKCLKGQGDLTRDSETLPNMQPAAGAVGEGRKSEAAAVRAHRTRALLISFGGGGIITERNRLRRAGASVASVNSGVK